MPFSLRNDWRELKRGRPGRRFQDRYEHAKRASPNSGAAKRAGTFLVAAIALVVGVFFAVFPGPAIPFFIVAGALLATHSRAIARAMDWTELRARDAVAWLRRRWRRLSRPSRVAVVLAGLGCAAMLAFFTYRFFRG